MSGFYSEIKLHRTKDDIDNGKCAFDQVNSDLENKVYRIYPLWVEISFFV
jgi:hypothetical protein